MKRIFCSLFWGCLNGLVFYLESLAAPPLAVWDFNGNNPSLPSVGAGSWHTLGGVTNSMASGAGSSDPRSTGDQALTLSRFPNATNGAAAAGIEFLTGTVGYRDIQLRFDLRATATASRFVRASYSLDGGKNYTEGPRFALTNAGNFQNEIVVDLRQVPDAADQPDLRVRLVAETGSSGRFEGVNANYSPSGTWRLDQVMFLGEPLVAVPPVILPAPPLLTFTNYISGRTHLGEPVSHSFAALGMRPGESLRLVVTVQDTNNRPVVLRAAAAATPTTAEWELPATAAPTAQAIFKFVATPADAGSSFRFGLITDNGSTNALWWSIYVPTADEQQLVISEFLANPPAGTPEFVELVRLGRRPLDLEGWTLSDAAAARHRFVPGSRIAGGGAVVIWGGVAPGLVPATAQFLRASTGGLSLNNGGDILELRNAQSNLIERIVYRGADLTNNSSLVRSALPDGSFRPHRLLSSQGWSPGESTDGQPWIDPGSADPAAIRVQRIAVLNGDIRLEWDPVIGRVARVLRATDLDAAFKEIARNQADGHFNETTREGSAFYRVEWQ